MDPDLASQMPIVGDPGRAKVITVVRIMPCTYLVLCNFESSFVHVQRMLRRGSNMQQRGRVGAGHGCTAATQVTAEV